MSSILGQSNQVIAGSPALVISLPFLIPGLGKERIIKLGL
jgi:hypothetical protein